MVRFRAFILLATLLACPLAFPPTALGAGVEVIAETAKVRWVDEDHDRPGDFGQNVSLDGRWMAVSTGPSDFRVNRVLVFEQQASGRWWEVAEIPGKTHWNAEDFSNAVSLDGHELAIGDPGWVVLVERQPNGDWVVTQEIERPVAGEWGRGVSLDGNRLAVTGKQHFHIYEREASGPFEEVIRAQIEEVDDVSLSGDRVALGQALEHTVSIYLRGNDGTWSLSAVIEELPRTKFGASVDLQGDRLLVGSPANTTLDEAAYIFEYDGANWVEMAAFTNVINEDFGREVALDGDIAAVGIPERRFDDDRSGAVALYERSDAGHWQLIEELSPSDKKDSDRFGAGLAVEGRRIAVGAPDDLIYGSTYFFEQVNVFPEIDITGECPGEITLHLRGLTPWDFVETYAASEPGQFELEQGSCAGQATLGLERPIQLIRTQVDADQKGALTRTAKDSWCGRYVQALDKRTCLVSAVAQIPTER